MQNLHKNIKSLDDRFKTREEIAAMIESMMNTDENGNYEKEKTMTIRTINGRSLLCQAKSEM